MSSLKLSSGYSYLLVLSYYIYINKKSRQHTTSTSTCTTTHRNRNIKTCLCGCAHIKHGQLLVFMYQWRLNANVRNYKNIFRYCYSNNISY